MNTTVNMTKSSPLWKNSKARAVVLGTCVALVCGAAMAINAKSTAQVEHALTVAGIEGNAIIEFRTPAHSAMNPHYSVSCSAVGSTTIAASAQANFEPVVVSGLEAGKQYDCRAIITADAGTLKSVQVSAVGQ